VIVTVFAFVGSLILYKVTDLLIPLRVTDEQEHEGLDLSQHGETALAVAAITNGYGNGHKNGVVQEPLVGVHA
jgi:Amt family ammonium transporter